MSRLDPAPADCRLPAEQPASLALNYGAEITHAATACWRWLAVCDGFALARSGLYGPAWNW